MRRLLITYEKNIPTISLTYELFHRKHFLDQGMIVSFKNVREVTKEDLKNNDAIYLARPNDVISARLSKQAQKSGLFVMTFCDDDLFHLPKGLPNIPYRKRMLKKCLINSNIFITNSAFFAKQRYGLTIDKRYFLINTIVDSKEMVTHLDNEKVKFLYAGSVTHKPLFNKFLSPIFEKFMKEYGSKVSFTFIGVHPDVEEYQKYGEINFYPSMSLDNYRKFVKDNNFDYGVAPLISDNFTKCKYFNKYLEYSLSGIVGIFSNTEPYSPVINNGINGYLVNDDPEEWYTALKVAVEEYSKRKEIVETAQEDIRNNYSSIKVFSSLFENIPELLNHDRGNKKVYGLGLIKLNYRIHRLFDITYLLLYHLFSKGPRGLIKQIKLHQQESKANAVLEEK